MKLGIFLAPGESFSTMAKTGQDVLFKNFYISAFAKNFEQVFIFTYANEKVHGIPKNVKVILAKPKMHRYLYSILLPFLNFREIVKCDVFRVYHLSGTVPAIITRLFYGKPFIFNWAYNYEIFANTEGKIIQEYFYKFLKPFAVLFSTKIFAANKVIIKSLPGKKTVYLPNGTDASFFKPIPYKRNLRRKTILSVGRLEKQKNYENLISAMEEINADLRIIGQGSLQARLQKLAKEKNVKLKIIGKVKNSFMPNFYNQADFFVLPSLIEGHPKVLLEAMSCGLPVIGSKVEGITDIIRHNQNGILVNTNVNSLKAVIKWCIANPNRLKKFRLNARRTVTENFDLNTLLAREISEIKAIINN